MQPKPASVDLADVRAWIAADPDPETKRELSALLLAGDLDEIGDRFAGTLQFGTAGLRGRIGAGPNRMNRAVVIRAAKGIAEFATSRIGPARAPARAVIGFDARHMSAEFARDTAAVFTAAGIHALLMPRPLPTPVLAFAVRSLEADIGVMVTASHNPAQDNGYKVYLGGRIVTGWGQGAQLIAPFDQAISDLIAQAGPAHDVPRAATGWSVLDDEIVDEYVLAALTGTGATSDPKALRIVHTAMHGVGAELMERLFAAAGFADVHPVEEQRKPDPDFPTVSFPNPEEPGALDLAIAKATEVDADIVIASDPDADRCAVAVRDPHEDGRWRRLHGDELGVVLGERVASALDDAVPAGAQPTLACSIVSSRLLGKIAADHRLAFATTLTGFKWLARTPDLVFGYEEAIGYCVDPAHVRDKDGLTAGLLVAGYARELKAAGRGIVDVLDDLARRHDLYLTDQLSARFTDLAQIPQLMGRLRAEPPSTLAGEAVTETIDLEEGASLPGAKKLPPTDGLLLAMPTARVVIRPSGTEPKLKCYLEVIEPVAIDASFEQVGAARRAARTHLEALKESLRPHLAP